MVSTSGKMLALGIGQNRVLRGEANSGFLYKARMMTARKRRTGHLGHIAKKDAGCVRFFGVEPFPRKDRSEQSQPFLRASCFGQEWRETLESLRNIQILLTCTFLIRFLVTPRTPPDTYSPYFYTYAGSGPASLPRSVGLTRFTSARKRVINLTSNGGRARAVQCVPLVRFDSGLPGRRVERATPGLRVLSQPPDTGLPTGDMRL